MSQSIIEHKLIRKNLKVKVLEDYGAVCNIGIQAESGEITASELKARIDQNNKIQILDVREKFEFDICKIENSILIPLTVLASRHREIRKDIDTVVICHHGIRSLKAIEFLEQFGYGKLINLKGGIHAWANEVDPEMEQY